MKTILYLFPCFTNFSLTIESGLIKIVMLFMRGKNMRKILRHEYLDELLKFVKRSNKGLSLLSIEGFILEQNQPTIVLEDLLLSIGAEKQYLKQLFFCLKYLCGFIFLLTIMVTLNAVIYNAPVRYIFMLDLSWKLIVIVLIGAYCIHKQKLLNYIEDALDYIDENKGTSF